jgi:hypothetical protein
VPVPPVEDDFADELTGGLVGDRQVQPVGLVGAGLIDRLELLPVEGQVRAPGEPADLRVVDDGHQHRYVVSAERAQDHDVARQDGLGCEVAHRRILVDRVSLGNRLVGCPRGPPGALVASRRGRRYRGAGGQRTEAVATMAGPDPLALALPAVICS